MTIECRPCVPASEPRGRRYTGERLGEKVVWQMLRLCTYTENEERVVSDGREEREERERRIEQEKREDREDRVNREDPDEWKPERVDS